MQMIPELGQIALSLPCVAVFASTVPLYGACARLAGHGLFQPAPAQFVLLFAFYVWSRRLLPTDFRRDLRGPTQTRPCPVLPSSVRLGATRFPAVWR